MKILTLLVQKYIEYPAKSYSGVIESQMELVAGKSIDNLFAEAQLDFERYAKSSLDLYFKDKKVSCLDIGCGFGRLTKLLPNCVGIDINTELIMEARKQNSDLKFYTYNLFFNYPLESRAVDYCFSYAAFIHCKSFSEVLWNLREIERVLKPGGIATLNFRIVPRGFRQTVHSYVQLNRFCFVLLKRNFITVPWFRKNASFYGIVVNERKFRSLLRKIKNFSHVSTSRNYPERTIFYTIKKN